MANHKSAEKRHRQSLRRRESNRDHRSAVRTAVARVRSAVQSGDLKGAQTLFKTAERTMAKAANKGVVHKKNAARRISRLAVMLARAGKK